MILTAIDSHQIKPQLVRLEVFLVTVLIGHCSSSIVAYPFSPPFSSLWIVMGEKLERRRKMHRAWKEERLRWCWTRAKRLHFQVGVEDVASWEPSPRVTFPGSQGISYPDAWFTAPLLGSIWGTHNQMVFPTFWWPITISGIGKWRAGNYISIKKTEELCFPGCKHMSSNLKDFRIRALPLHHVWLLVTL